MTIELNNAEVFESRCRLTFVIENKDAAAIESLKLDLVVFNRDNRVHRRMLAEMGPLRGTKTIVKSDRLALFSTFDGVVMIDESAAHHPPHGHQTQPSDGRREK